MPSGNVVTFIETKPFSESWEEFELPDEDLQALQNLIMRSPRSHPVIPATGGLRKMRFAPPSWLKGKRGALRVCFVYFQEYGIVLLTLVYSKREKADLGADDKKAIRQLIQREEKVLSERSTKQRKRP